MGFVSVVLVGASACASNSQPETVPHAPQATRESSVLQQEGCSIEMPGRWNAASTPEFEENGDWAEWEATSVDGESHVLVSVVRPEASKLPDREAVDALLGLRQDAERMQSGDEVVFSSRHFDEDSDAPGGFYASEIAGAEPMVTLVRWTQGRTCVFYVTGQTLSESNPVELGRRVLGTASAEPRTQ